MNTLLSDLKPSITRIEDLEDRKISEAMVILLTALEVGPYTEPLVAKTGYPRDFVASIVSRMHEAKLWHEGLIDDRGGGTRKGN